jgi:hypothetical protein
MIKSLYIYHTLPAKYTRMFLTMAAYHLQTQAPFASGRTCCLRDTDKLSLIMGNHVPAINHISNEYTVAVIQNWRTEFLEVADSPLTKLWKKRAQLIVETFPEWSISSADPTSIIRRLHED